MSTIEKRKAYVLTQISTSKDVLKGSVYEMKRFCGKVSCKCIKNSAPHKSTFLSFKYKGKTRLIPIKTKDISKIKEKIKKYQKLKENIELLTWINSELLKQE